jgi:hypothetical protein
VTYPDTRDGARALLLAEGYPERSGTDVIPDPVLRHVWAVRFYEDGRGAVLDVEAGTVDEVTWRSWPPRTTRR